MNLIIPCATAGIAAMIGLFRGDPAPTFIEMYIAVGVSIASYNAYMGNK